MPDRNGERPIEELEEKADKNGVDHIFRSDDDSEVDAKQIYLDKFHSHQVRAGRAGGLARTEAKRAATRANLAKARLTRWKGREAANKAMEEALRKLREGKGGQVSGIQEEGDAHFRGASDPQRGSPEDKEEG